MFNCRKNHTPKYQENATLVTNCKISKLCDTQAKFLAMLFTFTNFAYFVMVLEVEPPHTPQYGNDSTMLVDYSLGNTF